MKRAVVIAGRLAVLTAGGRGVRGVVIVDDTPSTARVGVAAVGYVSGLMVTVTSNPAGAPLVDVLGLNLRAQIPGTGSTLIPWASLVEGPLPSQIVIQARPAGLDGPLGPYSEAVPVDLSELIDPEALPSCIQLPSLSFSASPPVQGSTITATPGVWTGATQGAPVAIMRWSPAAGGAPTEVTPIWTVVPAIDGDILLQIGSRAVAQTGAVVEAWSAQYRIYDPDLLRTIVAADLTLGDAVFEPGDQTTWWRPRISVPGLIALSPYAIRWRRPSGAAEPMEALGGGVYRPVSAAPGSPGSDPSYFANDGDRQIQFSWQASSGGPWSPWSASITLPAKSTGSVIIAPVPTAAVTLGMRRSLMTYNVDAGYSDLTEGQTVNSPWTSRSFVAVALAAWRGDTTVYTGGALPGGGRTPAQRLLDQLRHWAANRVPPGTYGYAAQYQSPFVLTVCIAKTMPSIWGQLTTGEQTRLDLALKASLLASAFIAGDSNPFWPGGQSNERTIRGFMAGRSNVANFSVAGRLTPFLIAHVLGVSAAASFLNTWTRAAFLADIEAAFAAYIPGSASARCDLWETFRRQWTAAVQVEMHGTGHGGQTGPTEAQIQASIRDWSLTYNDAGGAGNRTYRLGDGGAFLPVEIRRCCRKTVKPGLGPNLEGAGASVYGIYESNPAVSNARNSFVGRLLNMADAPELPNLGATGMWDEFDSSDGGKSAPRSIGLNVRSALSYSMDGYSVLVSFVAAYIVLGLADADHPQMASAMSRFEIATRDLEYKVQHGYRDVAKGGRPSANCSDYPAGGVKAESERQISVPIALHDAVIQPWFSAA